MLSSQHHYAVIPTHLLPGEICSAITKIYINPVHIREIDSLQDRYLLYVCPLSRSLVLFQDFKTDLIDGRV